ncbi:MAG: LON peptidase substrate-binding domain-containing protein [Planctomycetales bacterium]|nr:LON peptidase substrate-binding domain-containing protein [Planctomycetales bacterium]
MTNLQSSAGWPEDFTNYVRLFPLPNLVLFPHVVQPLHIFEARYCDLLNESIKTDRLIGMALLEKGWEKHYLQRPPIASTICIAKVLSHTPTEDGRHNILLVGMKRAVIVRELDEGLTYRTAEVKLVEDLAVQEQDQQRAQMFGQLKALFQQLMPEGLAVQQGFQQLLGHQLPLGVLTDSISYALNLPLAVKQQLLSECNVDVRCRLLIRCLQTQLHAKGGDDDRPEDFPPLFSPN